MLFRSRKDKRNDQRVVAIVERQNTTLPEDATDDLVITMWLKQRPVNTRSAYQTDIASLRAFTNDTPLKQINLFQLQQWTDSMSEYAPSSIARHISAAKSLLSFCHKAGYTQFNVGAALRSPKVEEKLAEKIMSEASMQKILALETDQRNHALLRLLYNAGLRVSEVVALTWNDVQEREQGGQIRAYGKGNKERYILISPETYQEMVALRKNSLDFAPVFQSRKTTKGGYLTRGQVNKIVEAAAIRASIAVYEEDGQKRSRVSPHWIRHAHASHAIDKGAPVTLVRDTLGHASIATTNKYSHARPDASSGTYLAV